MENTSTKSSYRFVMCAVAFMIQISSALSIKVVAPIGSLMRNDLNMNFAQFGYIFSLINLGTFLLLTWVGNKADTMNPRPIAPIGQLIAGLALIIGAFVSQNPYVLLFFFLIVGFGNSVAGVCSAKAIAGWFDSKGRAGAMGIKQSAIPFGGMLVASVMPAIALAVGWRNAMAMDGGLIILLGIIGFILYREPQGAAEARQKAIDSGVKRPSFIAGIKVACKNRNMVLLSLAGFVLLGCQYVYTSYCSLYMTDVMSAWGLSNDYVVIMAGMCLTVSNLGGGVGSCIWGNVSDKLFHAKRRPVLLGLNVLATIAVIIMALGAPYFGVVGCLVVSCFVGLCWSSWSGLWVTYGAETMGVKNAGMASGFCLSCSFLGMTVMPLIFGQIFNNCSFKSSWIILAVCNILGIILLLVSKEKKKEETVNKAA